MLRQGVKDAKFNDTFLMFRYAMDVTVEKVASQHGDGLRQHLVQVTATLYDLRMFEKFMRDTLMCEFVQDGKDQPTSRLVNLGTFRVIKSSEEVHSENSSGADSMGSLSHISAITPNDIVQRRAFEFPPGYMKSLQEKISGDNQTKETMVLEERRMMQDVAFIAGVVCDKTSFLNPKEAADALIRLYVTDITNIKRDQLGMLDPSDADLERFALSVKSLLGHHLSEKYMPCNYMYTSQNSKVETRENRVHPLEKKEERLY